jgi:hypothetical protein
VCAVVSVSSGREPCNLSQQCAVFTCLSVQLCVETVATNKCVRTLFSAFSFIGFVCSVMCRHCGVVTKLAGSLGSYWQV